MKNSDLIFSVGLVAYVVTRGVFAHRSKTVETTERRFSKTEAVMLALVMVGSLLLPVLYLVTPLLNFANYVVPVWAVWTGTTVMVAALRLFWRSHVDLDRNWSPTLEIRSEHTLVTHGVYRTIRHPMYASIIAWTVAQALLLNNAVAGFSGAATFLPLYFLRVPHEERMMRDQFGSAYVDYAARTGRLLPRLRIPDKHP